MTLLSSDQNSNSSSSQPTPENVATEVSGNQGSPGKLSEFSPRPAAVDANDTNATTDNAPQGLGSVFTYPNNVERQGSIPAGVLQAPHLAPHSPIRSQLIGPHLNAMGPFRGVDPRFSVPPQHPVFYPPTQARPNSAPVAMGPPMLQRPYTPGQHQQPNAYHGPQFSNMASVMPQPIFPQHTSRRPINSYPNATGITTLANAPFNSRFAPGYGMPPGYYNPTSNAMLAITVQCPVGQPMINNPNVSSIQKRVPHPTAYSPSVPTIIPPQHWDFAPQGLFSTRPTLLPIGLTPTQTQCSRVKDEPQEGRLSNVKVEEHNDSISTNARSSILQEPRPSRGRDRTWRHKSSRGDEHRELSPLSVPLSASAGPSFSSSSSSSPGYKPGKKRPRVTSCYWDNCGMEVEGDADKLAYTRHLDEVHNFRGLASRAMTTCLWADPDTGEQCGKELQIQSMIKHVCEIHLNNLGMDCPMCGSYQARTGNMSRHWTVCAKYHDLDEENQRELWDEIISGGKGFDWYLLHRKEKE